MMGDRSVGNRTRCRPLLRLMLLAGGFLLGTTLADASGTGQSREYQVKAAFLFNFAKYGEWPDDSMRTGPFRFCITGRADVASMLADRLANQRVHELTIDILPLDQQPLASAGCHLLFITEPVTPEHRQALIDDARTLPVLLVGESADFLAEGGSIRLFVADGTVHFDVSLTQLRQHQLQLSSKLLRHADRVEGKSPAEASP